MIRLLALTSTIVILTANSFAQEYKDVPLKTNRIQEDGYYGEIMNRSPTSILEHERGTNAHESIHFINAEYSNLTFGKQRAFYITGEKRVYYTSQPKLLKDDVKEFVPNSLRGSRYKTYLEQAAGWNNIPTYIMDEWVAYIGGGMVALEDYENKRNRDISDRVCGALEFSVYSIALCMAIQEKDPDFWNENKDFRDFVKSMLTKSYDVFYRGRYVKDFYSLSQEQILGSLQSSDDAEDMRQFLRQWFDGIWLEKNDFNFVQVDFLKNNLTGDLEPL